MLADRPSSLLLAPLQHTILELTEDAQFPHKRKHFQINQQLLYPLRPWLAGHGICGTSAGDEGAVGHGGDAGEADVGHVAGFTGEGEVFSQREEGVAFPHEDAAEIGVTGKFDAHHVPDFTLMPIGGRPDVAHGRHFFIIGDLGFDAEMLVMAVTSEFIDHLESWLLTHLVEAGDVHEVVKGQLVFAVFQDRFGSSQGDIQRVLTAKFDGAEHGGSKLFLQGGDHLGGIHGDETEKLREFVDEFLLLLGEGVLSFDLALQAHETF
jgi:hypothetical protein